MMMAASECKHSEKMGTCSNEEKYSRSLISNAGKNRPTFSWKKMISNEYKHNGQNEKDEGDHTATEKNKKNDEKAAVSIVDYVSRPSDNIPTKNSLAQSTSDIVMNSVPNVSCVTITPMENCSKKNEEKNITLHCATEHDQGYNEEYENSCVSKVCEKIDTSEVSDALNFRVHADGLSPSLLNEMEDTTVNVLKQCQQGNNDRKETATIDECVTETDNPTEDNKLNDIVSSFEDNNDDFFLTKTNVEKEGGLQLIPHGDDLIVSSSELCASDSKKLNSAVSNMVTHGDVSKTIYEPEYSLHCLYEGSYLLLDDDCVTIPEELSIDMLDEEYEESDNGSEFGIDKCGHDDVGPSESNQLSESVSNSEKNNESMASPNKLSTLKLDAIGETDVNDLLAQLKDAQIALKLKDEEIANHEEDFKLLSYRNVHLEEELKSRNIARNENQNIIEEKKSHDCDYCQDMRSLEIKLHEKEESFNETITSFQKIVEEKDLKFQNCYGELEKTKITADQVPALTLQLDEANTIIKKNTTKLLSCHKELDSLRAEKATRFHAGSAAMTPPHKKKSPSMPQCSDASPDSRRSPEKSQHYADNVGSAIRTFQNPHDWSDGEVISKDAFSPLNSPKIFDMTHFRESHGPNRMYRQEELMRHVRNLALALQKSEEDRADVLDKIISERRNNAQSLKRLQDAVKLLYAKSNFRQ